MYVCFPVWEKRGEREREKEDGEGWNDNTESD